MPENTPGFTPSAVAMPPYSLLGGGENLKLLFDEVLDNRREMLSRSRAWESLTLLQHGNLAAFSHAVNMGSLLSAQAGVAEQQTGVTANQQPVSPIRTGAADAQNQQPAGAVYPPIRNVDQSGSTATGAIQTAQATVAQAGAALSATIVGIEAALGKLADLINALNLRAAGSGASSAGSGTSA